MEFVKFWFEDLVFDQSKIDYSYFYAPSLDGFANFNELYSEQRIKFLECFLQIQTVRLRGIVVVDTLKSLWLGNLLLIFPSPS